jgi:DNA-directed RNA polymerase specialized sigma24 family protein
MSRRAGVSFLDAEDCAQSAALALLELSVDRRRDLRLVEAWICTVAYRRALDLRRRELTADRAVRTFGAAVSRHIEDVSERVVDAAEAAWVVGRLRDLPPLTQALIVQIGGGNPIGLIADQLGITKRAAESRLHRARCYLRDVLDESFSGGPGIAGRPEAPDPALDVEGVS